MTIFNRELLELHREHSLSERHGGIVKPTVIACLGKGGTGKTLISTLTARIARDQGKRVLVVDADPVMGLMVAAGFPQVKTIAEAREEIVERVRNLQPNQDDAEAQEIVSFLISQCLTESAGMAFLAMGQTSSLGCYCSLNLLLRKVISALADQFDVVVIDAEAGIEQVNRQVVERVDWAFLLADGSQRAVSTCLMIRDTMARVPMMQECRLGVIFNRVDVPSPEHREQLDQAGIAVLGVLPADPLVSAADQHNGVLNHLDGRAAVEQRLVALLEAHGVVTGS